MVLLSTIHAFGKIKGSRELVQALSDSFDATLLAKEYCGGAGRHAMSLWRSFSSELILSSCP
jgi:hypothetical protein